MGGCGAPAGPHEAVLERLSSLPDRRSHPHELLELCIRGYRPVLRKRYRTSTAYRVRDQVYPIADGRRDMQTLPAQRLIRPR
jgi:hypothetical protein